MGNQEGRVITYESIKDFDLALAETLGFGRSLKDYEDYLLLTIPFMG